MKPVTVRFFAAFRDAAGVDTEQLSSDAADLRALFTELCQRHAGLAPETAALVAVNDEMRSWDDAFEAGDTVLFFPPVAGG